MERENMPNLRLDEFVEVDYLENELDMEIFVEPTVKTQCIACPKCGSPIVEVHAKEERFFRDINMYEKRVGVAIQGRRYKCKDCGKTFCLEYDCIEPSGKISKRLRTAIQQKALSRTFTSVAEEYGLGATTVINAFNEYSEILNLRPQVKAPRVLGIDECHLQKAMRPVYVDVENAVILEMGQSIKQQNVILDLMEFEGLDKVEVVTTDMCNGYRGAIQELMPNAIHIVDKFHVVQLFMNSVDEARKGILAKLKKQISKIADREERERQQRILAELNVDAYMFRMNPENMKDWRLNRLLEICDTYEDFAFLATLRKKFFDIYRAENEIQARMAYINWSKIIPYDDHYESMRNVAHKTFRNWGKEIFNYFNVTGRRTNAVTERLNGAIKSMQNMGRGYSFQVLRAKMLFGAETTKAPLYQRISRMQPTAADPETHATAYMKVGEPFNLNYSEGGGVVEPAWRYFDEKTVQALWREDRVNPEPVARTPNLLLLENGGAHIEKVIGYYQKHGECI